MRLLVLLCTLAAVTFAAADLPTGKAGDPPPPELLGAWAHNSLLYRFDDNGGGEQAMLDGSAFHRQAFRYTVRRFATHTLLMCKTETGAGQSILYFSSETDTTAIVAVGTPFVRADEDSTSPLDGTWRHISGAARIDLKLSVNGIAYRHSEIDTLTGVEQVREERHGTIKKDSAAAASGRLRVAFDDSTETMLFPLRIGDVLYLFDLAPRKSCFIRIEYCNIYAIYRTEFGI
jgi:hypothetical protein